MRKDEYRRFYELEGRHFWFRAMRAIVFDQVRGLAPATARALDVGCGTGGTLGLMPAAWRRAGVDLSAEAVAFAQARGERALARASAEALPFAAGRFDVVFALDVLEHCGDDRGAARELARVLAPGGTLVLTVPAFAFLWSEHDEAVEHRRRYRRPELRAVLESAGLTLRRVTYFDTLLFAPIAAVRLGKRLRPRPRRAPRSDVTLPPGPINAALRAVFEAERPLLRRIDLPFGVSLLALATRS